jgi:hypothetical protein
MVGIVFQQESLFRIEYTLLSDTPSRTAPMFDSPPVNYVFTPIATAEGSSSLIDTHLG